MGLDEGDQYRSTGGAGRLAFREKAACPGIAEEGHFEDEAASILMNLEDRAQRPFLAVHDLAALELEVVELAIRRWWHEQSRYDQLLALQLGCRVSVWNIHEGDQESCFVAAASRHFQAPLTGPHLAAYRKTLGSIGLDLDGNLATDTVDAENTSNSDPFRKSVVAAQSSTTSSS
jgi:hypothetical protein